VPSPGPPSPGAAGAWGLKGQFTPGGWEAFPGPPFPRPCRGSWAAGPGPAGAGRERGVSPLIGGTSSPGTAGPSPGFTSREMQGRAGGAAAGPEGRV